MLLEKPSKKELIETPEILRKPLAFEPIGLGFHLLPEIGF
jgi:hypothetical protein